MISFVRGRDNETPAGAENALALPSALPDDHTCTPDTGLSEDEAARRAAAELSIPRHPDDRTAADISDSARITCFIFLPELVMPRI